MPDEHDRDDHDLEQERDPPGQVGGDEAAEQRADGGGDRRRGADQRVGLPLHRGPSKLPWIRDCIAGSSSEAPSPPMIAQKMTIGDEALRQRHRQRADGVAEQPEHVGALAADQVADLAADQDERRRDERLEGDRRLHAADGRVEVLDDGGDRHVHERRVDHQDEHRHREQDREPLVPGRLLRYRGRCLFQSRSHPVRAPVCTACRAR